MNDESKYLVKLPDLQLQVFSFFELGAIIAVALAVYYLIRKVLLIFCNIGFLEKSSQSYKVLNFISFLIPALIFLFGLTQVSKDSFFISLLFFVIISFISGFALLDPARALIATLMIQLKGDLREGDFVQVGDTQGKILQVGPLSLVIQSRSGNKIYVPTHRVLKTSYEVHNRGGGSMVAIELDGTIDKQKIERLAHLCPYKKENSDVVVTRKNDQNLVKIEVHHREMKPMVEKYFLHYL